VPQQLSGKTICEIQSKVANKVQGLRWQGWCRSFFSNLCLTNRGTCSVELRAFQHYSTALNTTSAQMLINAKDQKAADEGKQRLRLPYPAIAAGISLCLLQCHPEPFACHPEQGRRARGS